MNDDNPPIDPATPNPAAVEPATPDSAAPDPAAVESATPDPATPELAIPESTDDEPTDDEPTDYEPITAEPAWSEASEHGDPEPAELGGADPARPGPDAEPTGGEWIPPAASSVRDTRRHLRRSSEDRIIGGVAGGVGDYFDIDPVIVRIAIVVLSLAGGTGVLAYLAAWLLIPESDGTPSWLAGRFPSAARSNTRQLGAIAAVGVGAVILLDRVGLGVDDGIAVPLALIGGGAAVLWGRRDRDVAPSPGGTGDGGRWTEPSGGTATGGPWIGPDDRLARPRGGPTRPGGGPAGPGGGTGGFGSGGQPSPNAPWAPRAQFDAGQIDGGHFDGGRINGGAVDATHRDARSSREAARAGRASRGRRAGRAGRTPYARAALGLLVAIVGVAILIARVGSFDQHPDRVLSYALVGIGAALVLGARFGRPRGFILLGLTITTVLMATTASDVSWRGGFGDRRITPTSDDVQRTYNLAAGTMSLDLSQVDMTGRRVTVAAEVALGELRIEVPTSVRVVSTGRARVGEVVLFRAKADGSSVRRSAESLGANPASGTLYLDAKVGVGRVEVARKGQLVESSGGAR